MTPSQFKRLCKADSIDQILALIPKDITQDPYWTPKDHLKRQYATMLIPLGYKHAEAWAKASVGHLLYANDEQQKRLTPLGGCDE